MNQRTRRRVVFTALLILLAVLLRSIGFFNEVPVSLKFAADSLRSVIYIALFAGWGISLRMRIIQTQARRYLIGISALMVFWMIVRSLKYLFFYDTHIGRYCWYLYYLPMLFIPLLALFVALSLGRPENFRLRNWANALFLVSAFLFLLVLTNDLHQLDFDFLRGPEYYESSDYVHRLCYYLSMAWIVICTSAALGFMIVRSHVPGSRMRIWLPSVFLLAIGGYAILYETVPEFISSVAGDMTVVVCLLTTAALESCIQCGLIQSNTHYNELFAGCGICAVITDRDYRVQYATAVPMNYTEEQLHLAARKPVEPVPGTILESMPLEDGYIFWQKDVSELRQLQMELRSNAATLSQEAELLAEEAHQKEEKAATDMRNHLYDMVSREIAPQIAAINGLIYDRSGDPDSRRKTLKKMCVLGAYVKRRCNLIFLNEQQKIVSSMELYHCLQESAEYLIQYGVPCSVEHLGSGSISIEHAKLIYDFFETAVETVLEALTAFSVQIRAEESRLQVRLMAECRENAFGQSELLAQIYASDGKAETDHEDGVWYCVLTLPEGGSA